MKTRNHESHIGPSCVPMTRICSLSLRSFSTASWLVWMKKLKETAMKMILSKVALECGSSVSAAPLVAGVSLRVAHSGA